MNERIESATEAAMQPKVVIERVYRASAEELWKLWTTREGFESWWAPEGFRTKVHAIEARPDGPLQYDMIAEAPEVVAALNQMGLAASHVERARFAEFRPPERLVLAIMMDFLPGVAAYENRITVDFIPSGGSVRMAVALCPMHTEDFTRLCAETLAGQLTNLERQLERSKAEGPE